MVIYPNGCIFIISAFSRHIQKNLSIYANTFPDQREQIYAQRITPKANYVLRTFYSSNVFSIRSVTMTAIGTASKIPKNPKISPQIIILMKITIGLTPKVLFINNGMSTLFSNRCNNITHPITINAPYRQKLMKATNAAAAHHTNGPIYGIISVIAIIPASTHFWGRSNPNNVSIHRIAYIATPINRQSMI